MKLTGKCKEDFEKWIETKEPEWVVDKDEYCTTELNVNSSQYFNQLPFPMQYGVYVDFFDSKGYNVDVQLDPFDGLVYWYSIQSDMMSFGEPNNDYKTRHEARAKAIEKANEIYNENN